MFGFKKEDCKIDENFKDSGLKLVGLSEYLCPNCNAHLRDNNGELICLNACHLPKQWQINFNKKMKKIQESKKVK